jgi:hypothetical protein
MPMSRLQSVGVLRAHWERGDAHDALVLVALAAECRKFEPCGDLRISLFGAGGRRRRNVTHLGRPDNGELPTGLSAKKNVSNRRLRVVIM